MTKANSMWKKWTAAVLAPSLLFVGCNASDDEPAPPPDEPVPTQHTTQAVTAPPDPGARPYVSYFESWSETEETWNYELWKENETTHHKGTRTIQIAANQLVLDDQDALHLVERFHDRKDVKELDLFADTVIVRRAIHVPSATIRIHARELRFEDSGDVRAVIDTTPIVKTSAAAAGIDGANGLRAGDIHAAVQTFFSDQNRTPRFIANGGAGQRGGAGTNGLPGSQPPLLAALQPGLVSCANNGMTGPIGTGVAFTNPGLTLAELQTRTVGLGQELPSNGGDAVAPGRSGGGGAGGSLHMIGNTNLALSLQAAAGAAATGDTSTGGPAGGPSPAVKLASASCQSFLVCFDGSVRPVCSVGGTTVQRLVVQVAARNTAVAGHNAAAPPPNVPTAIAGQAISEPGPFAWLHPHAVAMQIAFAEDLFATEFRDDAQHALEALDASLTAYAADASFGTLSTDDRTLLTQDSQRVRSLLNKLHSHEDFYGNPQGWVPELSLEANLALYQQEVEWAIRTIYVADWLTDANSQLKNKAAALAATKALLNTEIAKLQIQFDDALNKIPGLKTDAQNAGAALADLQTELQAVEAILMQRAVQNVQDRLKLPFWKKALRALVVIAKVLPVPSLQPQMGAIAKGVESLMNFDADKPWELVTAGRDIVASFKDTKIDEKAKEQKDKTAEQKPETKETKTGLKETVAEIQKYVGPVIEELNKQKALFKDAEIKKEELDKQVAAELDKLKEADEQFKTINDKFQAVTSSRAQLVASIESTTAALEQAATAISQHWLEISELLPALDHNQEVQLSQRSALALGDMRTKAYQRLKKYQYLLARSYEYRMLRKYPGDLSLNHLFDEVLVMIRDTSSTGTLTAAQYDALFALYREDISRIVEDVVDAYSNGTRRYLETSVGYELSAAELDQLNNGQPVSFDFWERGAFRDTDEDVRIVKLEVDDLQADQTGSAPFAFFDVETSHEGTSRIWRDGAVRVFKHYNNNTQTPLRWATRWEHGTVTQHMPSTSSQSLLLSLLPNTSADIQLFSRPSAWARLDMQMLQHGDGVSFHLRKAHVKLTYDFTSRVTAQSWAQYRDAQNATLAPLYQSLLHAPANAAELTNARALLDTGYSTADLTSTIIEANRPAYEQGLVDNMYQELFNRTATPDERSFWAAERANGRPEEQVRSYIQLITQMFLDIFRRAPRLNELVLWTQRLDDGVQI